MASFSILADMAREVAGPDADVTGLVAPGGDAHVYEPSPQDAARVAAAGLLIINGLGFDGFMDRFSGPARVVRASEGIRAIPGDPHGWQDPANAVIYVRNIAKGLCAADPAHCAAYQARAGIYAEKLTRADGEIRAAFAAIPPERRSLLTSHDSLGYFCRAYGIRCLSVSGADEHDEPSAADVAAIIRQVREAGIRAIFLENVSDPRLLEAIAAETGIAPAGGIATDALSEEGEASTYLGLIRANARAIAAAMR